MVTQLLLEVEEAARVLGIKRSKLYELIGSGELVTVKLGRCRRVPVAALEAYVRRLQEEAEAGQLSGAGR